MNLPGEMSRALPDLKRFDAWRSQNATSRMVHDNEKSYRCLKVLFASPFRDTNFVATTFILFADFLVLLMLSIRCRAQLSFSVVLWLLLGAGAMIFAWLLALRTHQSLQLLFETRQIEKLELI